MLLILLNEALEKTIKEYQDGTFGAEMEQLLSFAGLTAWALRERKETKTG